VRELDHLCGGRELRGWRLFAALEVGERDPRPGRLRPL